MTSLPFGLISGYFLNSILWLLSLSAVSAQPLCPFCFCKSAALNPDLLNPEFVSWICFELEIWCCPVIFAPFLIHVFNFHNLIERTAQSLSGSPQQENVRDWLLVAYWSLVIENNEQPENRNKDSGSFFGGRGTRNNTFSVHSFESIPDEIITTIIGAWNLYFNAITG